MVVRTKAKRKASPRKITKKNALHKRRLMKFMFNTPPQGPPVPPPMMPSNYQTKRKQDLPGAPPAPPLPHFGGAPPPPGGAPPPPPAPFGGAPPPPPGGPPPPPGGAPPPPPTNGRKPSPPKDDLKAKLQEEVKKGVALKKRQELKDEEKFIGDVERFEKTKSLAEEYANVLANLSKALQKEGETQDEIYNIIGNADYKAELSKAKSKYEHTKEMRLANVDPNLRKQFQLSLAKIAETEAAIQKINEKLKKEEDKAIKEIASLRQTIAEDMKFVREKKAVASPIVYTPKLIKLDIELNEEKEKISRFTKQKANLLTFYKKLVKDLNDFKVILKAEYERRRNLLSNETDIVIKKFYEKFNGKKFNAFDINEFLQREAIPSFEKNRRYTPFLQALENYEQLAIFAKLIHKILTQLDMQSPIANVSPKLSQDYRTRLNASFGNQVKLLIGKPRVLVLEADKAADVLPGQNSAMPGKKAT